MSTWRNFFYVLARGLKENGVKRTWRQVLALDQPKLGKYVGTDANGNNYYEDKAHIVNRDRWVEYKKWNYDTSSVVPEWHQWLHRITDDVPTEKTLPKPFFAGAPLENLTGSRGAFKTYSTTTPKISAWTGSAKPRQG